MKPAYYMHFHAGQQHPQSHGDRLGGLPSHLPSEYPLAPQSCKPLTFLAQFYCAPGRFDLPGTLCVQLYQDLQDAEAWPLAVAVPHGAAENHAQSGVTHPAFGIFEITWEERFDPAEVDEAQHELTAPKAGGTCYFWGMLSAQEQLLLQLREQPAGFQFNGYTAVLVLNAEGQLEVRMG